MEEKLCGVCAIKKGIDIETRKQMAVSVRNRRHYHCPSCKVYFKFDKQYIKSEDPLEIDDNELILDPIIESKIEENHPTKQVQTSLF